MAPRFAVQVRRCMRGTGEVPDAVHDNSAAGAGAVQGGSKHCLFMLQALPVSLSAPLPSLPTYTQAHLSCGQVVANKQGGAQRQQLFWESPQPRIRRGQHLQAGRAGSAGNRASLIRLQASWGVWGRVQDARGGALPGTCSIAHPAAAAPQAPAPHRHKGFRRCLPPPLLLWRVATCCCCRCCCCCCMLLAAI